MKRHSGIVWHPGPFRGIAPRRGREEIVGGLYSVTTLWENDQERVTVYSEHRLKLHSQIFDSGNVGGLYSVTALRESDQERVTVYTKHRLKLHSQTTLTNDRGLKNLDTRGGGRRIGEIVLPAHWCLLFVKGLGGGSVIK